jgi:hypothetical protein
MTRSFLPLHLCLFFLIITAAEASDNVVSSFNIPNHETPKELVQAWLRFHEADLCQGLDTTFIFTRNGMIVRSLVEDEKSYQKLEELLLPLQSSYAIAVDAIRPPEDTKSDDEKEPPASLWENHALRSFLGDPVERIRERPGFEDNPELAPPVADPAVKPRLMLFAERTLTWARKMELYAKDFPALTRIALDPTLLPGMRSRAIAICIAHAQSMEKYIAKLIANLEPAFPRLEKKENSARPEQSVTLKTPVDRADHLSELATTVANRVHQFIYPEHYSVGLDELRQPALIESLRNLLKTNSDFRSSLAKVKQ